jgi:hypothetical protein
MNSDDLKRFRAWFADYVANYFSGDPVRDHPLRLKQEHTERVCQEIIRLGEALELSPPDMLLAESMALFHDLGRFEQYASYGTFKDAVSENHAAIGLRELAKHKVLMGCPKEERSVITRAIAYHNVKRLPEKEDDDTLFFPRLLRDADKLDIWRVFIDTYEEEQESSSSTILLDMPDTQTCSPEILNALNVGEMADLKDMASQTDFKLLQMSWVFDLNNAPAFETVRKRRYVERIASQLPETKEIQQALAAVKGYLENKGMP